MVAALKVGRSGVALAIWLRGAITTRGALAGARPDAAPLKVKAAGLSAYRSDWVGTIAPVR